MICCFPDPYPDELFYSICARFSDRMQYPTKAAVSKELFGTRRPTVVVALANHLNHLMTTLPPRSLYTTTQFINEHTLLPFYEPFLESKILHAIHERMKKPAKARQGGANRWISNIIHNMPVEKLRLCSECVEEDRKKWKECYWHRVHQIPCVKVCPIHGVPLQQSSIIIETKKCISMFISAECASQIMRPEVNIPAPHYKTLSLIAHDASWLLNQHSLAYGPQLLRKQYWSLLLEQDLAIQRGAVKIEQVKALLRTLYPLSILQSLQCENHQLNWLEGLLSGFSKGLNPLHHILFIHLLGHTTESFFSLPLKHYSFGEGQWPSPNECTLYRQHHLKRCTVLYWKPKRGAPVLVYSCECGYISDPFIYTQPWN